MTAEPGERDDWCRLYSFWFLQSNVHIFLAIDAIAQTRGKVGDGEFGPDGAGDITESGEGHL